MDIIGVDGVSKNDMMFFQNEVLRDIKKLDNKFNSKLDEKNNQLVEKISILNQKITIITNQISELFNSLAIEKNNEDKITKFMSFKIKAEESIFVNEAKIQTLEKDLNDAIYRYDNMLNNNIFLPGLIGNSCKFPTLRDFLDYTNKTIKELIAFKEKEIVDLKLYKTKIENLIQQFQIQIETVQNKFNENINKKINELENKIFDRIKITDDKINVLRIENGKYSKDLIEQSTHIKIEWEKLEEFENKINEKIKKEMLKFENINESIKKLFNDNNNEFKLIKQKFTKLSEFIKDVRFRKNLNKNASIKEFKDMSNQIDFTKKQQLDDSNSKDDISDEFNNNDKNKTFNFNIEEEEVKIPSPITYRISMKEKNLNLLSKKNSIIRNVKKNKTAKFNEATYIKKNKTKNEKEEKIIPNIIVPIETNKTQNYISSGSSFLINDESIIPFDEKKSRKKSISDNENNNIQKKNENIKIEDTIENSNLKINNNKKDSLREVDGGINDLKKQKNEKLNENEKKVKIEKENIENVKKVVHFVNENKKGKEDIENQIKIEKEIIENEIKIEKEIVENEIKIEKENVEKEIKKEKENIENEIKKEKENIENEIKKEKENFENDITKEKENFENDIKKEKENIENDIKKKKENIENDCEKEKSNIINHNKYKEILQKDDKEISINQNKNLLKINSIKNKNINISKSEFSVKALNKNNQNNYILKSISTESNFNSTNKIYHSFEQKNIKKSRNSNSNDAITETDLITIIPLNKKKKNNISNINNNEINIKSIEEREKFFHEMQKKIDLTENHILDLEQSTSKKFEQILQQIKIIIENMGEIKKKKRVLSNVFTNNDNLSLGKTNNFLMTTINFSKKTNIIHKRKLNKLSLDENNPIRLTKGDKIKSFSNLNIFSDNEGNFFNSESKKKLNQIESFLIKKFHENK